MADDPSLLTLVDVPYVEDVAGVFAGFAHLPWSIFLDSGRPYSAHGRYEIFSAHPKKTFTTYGRKTIIEHGHQREVVFTDPFQLLAQELNRVSLTDSRLPFSGGALGFFAYDLGRRIEKIPDIATDDINMPDMAVGIYHWAYVADHHNKTATLAGRLSEPRVRLYWHDLIASVSRPAVDDSASDYRAVSAIRSNMDAAQYAEKFARVKQYIAAGDCYQINLAQRFCAQVQGNAWHGYKKLRKINPARLALIYICRPARC